MGRQGRPSRRSAAWRVDTGGACQDARGPHVWRGGAAQVLACPMVRLHWRMALPLARAAVTRLWMSSWCWCVPGTLLTDQAW